jgi:hypothetical protein
VSSLRHFTLLACANLTVEAALTSPAGRIVGTITLTGEPDEIRRWLPHHPDLVIIDHADGALYGDVSEQRFTVGALGFLTEKLGYLDLDSHLRTHETVTLTLDRTHLGLVARCLRAVTRQRLDIISTTLGTATPLTFDRSQVIALLIEGLILVAEREVQIAAGRLDASERLGIVDILPNLTPRLGAA